MIAYSTDQILERVARDANAIVDAAESAPDIEIPACPGWTASDLIRHVGQVHRFVTPVMAQRASGPVPADPSDSAPDDSPWEWYRSGLERLMEAMRAIGAHEPVWTWSDRRNGGFYHRRMLHEHTVHRHDIDSALGHTGVIDADVATDGIDEILDVSMRYRSSGAPIDYPTGSLLMVRTDGPQRWHVRALDGTLLVGRDADAGDRADARLSGPADELYLRLWGRRTPAVGITGDEAVAAAWAAVAP